MPLAVVQRLIGDLKSSQRTFERLRDGFEYRDAKGVDQGINVKTRARDLIALFTDPSRIEEERQRVGGWVGGSGGPKPVVVALRQ